MLLFDYIKSEPIQRFLQDHNTSTRFKAVVTDGCVIVHRALVIGAATRWAKSEKSVERKYPTLSALAVEALSARELLPLRRMIQGMVRVRNAAAHEPLADDEIRNRFFEEFVKVRGGLPDGMIGDPTHELVFSKTVFAWILVELGRWQAGLDPGYLRR